MITDQTSPATAPPARRQHPNRLTIGLLTARIGRTWGNEFILGACEAAQALDTNLLCIVGGQPSLPGSDDLSFYDQIDPRLLDGMIFAADLGHGSDPALITDFCQRFAPLPRLALALEVSGIPQILTDNLKGIYQVVTHLIEIHGLQRIAFIGGPAGQVEAEQRFQGYRAALQDHQIAFDPSLVRQGDFSLESGQEAAAALLDGLDPAPQAIVAASDRMAFGALDTMQRRGIQVPDQVALVGFDDVLEAQALGVPLTTVRQPFYLSGQRAVQELIRQIRGESLPDQIILPAEQVIRWSCGCLPPAIRQVASLGYDQAPSATNQPLVVRRAEILAALYRRFTAAAIPGTALDSQEVEAMLAELWEAFLLELNGGAQSGFLKAVNHALATASQLHVQTRDLFVWHELVSEFRRQVLPVLTEQGRALLAENMLEQARILVGEAALSLQTRHRLDIEQQESLLERFSSALASLASQKDIARTVEVYFNRLGVQRCLVALYDLPESQLNLREVTARLFLHYEQGQVRPSLDEASFPAQRWLPPAVFPSQRRFTAILTHLRLGQNVLGYLWNEVGPTDWEIYSRVNSLLSNALLRTRLTGQREQAMQEIGKLLLRAEQNSLDLSMAKETAEEAARRTQRALEETDLLFRAARDILGATSIPEICRQLTNHSQLLAHPSHVLVFIVDSGLGKISLAMHNGVLEAEPLTSYAELTGGLSGAVLQSGQPILAQTPADGIELPASLEERMPVESAVAVPLVSKGEVIGTVIALNSPGERPFTQGDMEVLTSLATQAGVSIESVRIYQAEQERRKMAESLVQAGRRLTSTLQLREVPGYILEQLSIVVPYERASLILQEADNPQSMRIVAQRGFPDTRRTQSLHISIRDGDVYQQVVAAGGPVRLADVTQEAGWQQVAWLPVNHSWMGVPLFNKQRIIGMLSITRREPGAFSEDDEIMASTFALQAAIALENANLYEEITRFNEQLEQMVAQRTEELDKAYHDLEKLDKNKTDFINVAAHELRTPLTVIKGYMDMIGSDPSVIANPYLVQVVNGVLRGAERLHTIINSMLDVARIENQVLDLHREPTSLPIMMKRIQADFEEVLAERNIHLGVMEIETIPVLNADPNLMLKVFQNLVGNAIKFTPDGGTITLSGRGVIDPEMGACVEIAVQDTGIGIDPDHQQLIFEKFYQTGEVALHSSGQWNYKGGGPGLGLAIVRGIVQAHGGRIWVESEGQDEQRFPGSTFYVRLPGGARSN